MLSHVILKYQIPISLEFEGIARVNIAVPPYFKILDVQVIDNLVWLWGLTHEEYKDSKERVNMPLEIAWTGIPGVMGFKEHHIKTVKLKDRGGWVFIFHIFCLNKKFI